ncbi:hypothetical protein AAFO92_08835 [Roseovarius sp. CAU 1744]|uniref:hypothetical protein n=1 Tax=Roseovarius sp. CAU 1744 TaxID=3140368 RepID=UPI00325C15F6
MIPDELVPKKPPASELSIASKLIAQLELACDEGDMAPAALQELRSLTGKSSLSVEQFHEISGAMSYEDAALLAYCPDAVSIPNLTQPQFVWICEKMRENDLNGQFNYWFELFCINARNSQAGDLLFYPPQEWLDRLIQNNEVPPETTRETFMPSAQQLAREAWKSDAIAL